MQPNERTGMFNVVWKPEQKRIGNKFAEEQ
jgi:hypothetical protein